MGARPLAFRWTLLGLVAWLGWATPTRGAPWFEGFEGQNPSWRDAGGNAQYQIDRHQRVFGEAHTGRGAERLSVRGEGGTQVLLGHEIGRPRVIAELRPTVWVRSDRSGLQILAEVVLPRTTDPRVGQPVKTLLTGTTYSDVGRWQQLRIDNLPELLTRQVRVLRTQLGPQVDAREAYVDRILLNVYGGPGVTNVWIDDLDVAGYVGLGTGPAGQAGAGPGEGASAGDPGPAAGPSGLPSPAQPRRVELAGKVLKVDGQPVFVRAIQHQGEPLAKLKELGFNAVWLSQPASGAILAEATEVGLFVVCPPPPEATTPPAGPLGAPAAQIGPEFAPVVAWDLGWGLCEQDVDGLRSRAQQVRAADRFAGRPLVAHAEADLRGVSRHVDLLMVGQAPLGTSLELTDYGTWIRERPRLARPGTTVWSTVQTEPPPALVQQWVAGGRECSPPPLLTAEQIRLVAYTAMAAGSRGLLFESHGSLAADDPATRGRAAAMALLNLDIDLLHPWVAEGSLADTVPSGEAEVAGALFFHNRSRLLVPVWVGAGAQCVPGQSAGNTVRFVVPGVPDSARPYELTPGGLRPIADRQRVTGGVQVTIEEFSLSTLVLFTEDPRTIEDLRRRAAEIGAKAAPLQRQLAARKLEVVQEVGRYMAGRPATVWQPGDHLQRAKKYLDQCDAALACRDWSTAMVASERAMRRLRLVERASWQAALASLRWPLASPATACFSTLPWHWTLAEQARGWQLGPELLVGGDFESLQAGSAAGWRLFEHVPEGLQARADVIPEASHAGSGGLRLLAKPTRPDASPTLVETPPIWITSPPVFVQTGTLVRIQGWVHVPLTITGSVDGLLVFDSMSGPALAQRVGETTDWQPFALYRVATQTGPMSITLALAGLGEVWIDDLSIRAVGRAELATEPTGVSGQ